MNRNTHSSYSHRLCNQPRVYNWYLSSATNSVLPSGNTLTSPLPSAMNQAFSPGESRELVVLLRWSCSFQL